MMGGPDMMFGYWSLWHWVIFILVVALLLYPTGRILRRMGFSPLWSILIFFPIVNLIGLWIVALADWPRGSKSPG